MRYSLIREMDISNGQKVGISLFVQGCHFHCKGCFNQETWDFNGGKEWTPEIEEQFIELANRPYIQRISILGGEPLADENVETVYNLICKFKSKYPDKKIWLYTGYTWEDIFKQYYHRLCGTNIFGLIDNDANFNRDVMKSLYRIHTVYLSDVVVDGQFQLENQDLFNKKIVWAGSTNQRVIDAKKSFESHKVVLYGE